MIFTVGYTKNYERYFVEQGTPRKKGKCGEYVGGTVWQTYAEAKKHCHVGYSVYGVLATWGKDTQPATDGDHHDLLVDSILVKLKRP